MALASAAATFVGTRAEANTKKVVQLNKIKVGETFPFQLANGAPALLFRTKTGVFAYQTICTCKAGMTR
jgi:nitrite reductase/ring-hydroxylating ferredoxin subunit